MAKELAYHDEAAAEYDRAFAHVSSHFLPFLLDAAGVVGGMRVLDIATGTGLAAAECLRAVGPTGHVVAADLSEAMVEQARQRLGKERNITFAVENGQALSFDDNSFDAVTCSRINTVIAKHLPAIGEATARTFALGDVAHLRQLFERAGFRDIKISREAHRFTLPSFDAYFGPFERGGASTGQAYLTLSQSERDAVRKEVQRCLGDSGGPVEIEVEFQFASGQRG